MGSQENQAFTMKIRKGFFLRGSTGDPPETNSGILEQTFKRVKKKTEIFFVGIFGGILKNVFLIFNKK
jgi:hypothetical protein